MKRVLFAFVFASILLSFGLANAMTFQVSVDNTWTDGVNDYIKAGNDFVITVSADNPDADRTGISMPLAFYMTGDATAWTLNPTADGDGYLAVGAWAFDPINWGYWWAFWTRAIDMYNPVATSWDGVDADTVNWTGSGNPGFPAGSPMGPVLEFHFGAPAFTDLVSEAVICVDSCHIPDTQPAPDQYDWLFEDPSPSFGGPYCFTIKKQPNENAYFTNCPTSDLESSFDVPFSYDFEATETEGDTPYTYAVLSGPGAFNGTTWEFDAECTDVGSHSVQVGVFDTEHIDDYSTCDFTITVTDQPPVIGGDCNTTLTVGVGDASKTLQFTATDPNAGDVLTFSVDIPGFAGAYAIDANTGLFTVEPDLADADIVFTGTVTVTDCNGQTDACEFIVNVISEVPFKIVIDKLHGEYQGHHSYLPVFVDEGSEIMLGFDFLIGYDQSLLTFVAAIGGELFDMEGAYQWEYFTYRYNYNGNCGNGCPSGLLRVVGMAEYNDGPHHPAIGVVPAGMVLFTLDFLVSSDYNANGMYAPVNFYWMDCGDNAIAFNYRSADPFDISTALADSVFWYQGEDLYTNVTATDPEFPTFFGVESKCFGPFWDDPDKPLPIPFAWFYGGGIDIISIEEIDDKGDVNLNGVGYEIADAVVFTNYFIYGINAFTINPEGQKAATEVNGDGIALTVADLVYLIRVIVGDALPIPKERPNITVNAIANGQEVILDNEVGAARFVFEGNVAVTLGEGASGMELKTGTVNGTTVALVYSFAEGMTASGSVLNTDGNLISVEAADYSGNLYKTVILAATFGMANYPNPFNPSTTLQMSLPIASDWTIDVYNVLGQKVADYSGYSEAGIVKVEFDGSRHGSGVYFYRAQAGSFSATEKMVMLK